MQTKSVIKYICQWIEEYASTAKCKGFVIGISGGIDSAVTSTLAAKTNIPLLCVEMPIKAKRRGFKLSTIPSFERSRIAGTKKVNAFWDGLLILIKMIKLFFLK